MQRETLEVKQERLLLASQISAIIRQFAKVRDILSEPVGTAIDVQISEMRKNIAMLKIDVNGGLSRTKEFVINNHN